MRPDGSSNNHLRSSASQDKARLVFERMSRYAGRLSKSLEPANVHRFRTNSRRVEALVSQLAPETRNKAKLLKLVSKLRKRAGKLRDLDVQIAILKGLRMPDRQNHRAQLLELLIQEHARRSRKLARALSAETVQELRKRLRREQEVIKLSGINPLRLASNILPKLDGMAMTEKALHAYRIAAKQARYLAELAGETPEADFFIQELCRAQDAIGEWHDIMKLKEKAEKRFGSASESALVSMLQNVSRARFRAACNALTSSLATLSQQQPARRPASPVQRDAGPAAPTGASSEPATNAAVA